jgi:hypothetical protein
VLTVSLVAAVPGDFAHFEHCHHLQRYQLNASRLAAGRWNALCTCCVIVCVVRMELPSELSSRTPKQPYRATTFCCHRPKLDLMST